MIRSHRLAALLSTGSLLTVAAGLGLAGCGGDDASPAIPAGDSGSDQQNPAPIDATMADVATDANVDTDADDGATDAGADASATDAGDASDGGACSLSVSAISPAQGWNGVDIPVTISGSGFGACIAPDGGTDAGDAGDAGDGGDGGDAGIACSDRFKLVAAACDAGACADSGSVNWALTTVSVTAAGATAIVPRGAPLGGPYTLVDTQNGCQATLPGAFTVLGSTVTVSKVVPPYGWTGAATPITVTGAGFVSTPNGTLTVPAMSPTAQKLRSTAFVSATSLTSIVPAGLTAGGPYDLTILNPDYTGGLVPGAFRVVSLPVPSISNLAPASLTTSQLGVANNVTLTGCNFRSPLTVSAVDATGASTAATAGTLSCAGAATCPGGTNVCTLQATIPTLATGAFVVRVTNTDQSTAGDYSALVVTNPSAKLSTGFAPSPKALGTPRRALATTSGRINDASRFLYAMGGESGAGAALDSIEVAPLDLYGTLGDWYTQRNRLTVARSGPSVVQAGKYIYVIGGTSTASGTGGAAPAGTPLGSIERAKILDLTDLPSVGDPATTAVGNLAAGTWYYRVAVVRDATDPDNPNGEGLPSDEVVASLSAKGSAIVTWTAPSNALHVSKYRVYRSPAVNGSSHSEQLLYETANAATLTYTDDGGAAIQAQKPLDRGTTGVFVVQTSALVNARLDASAIVAADPAGQLYVYVTGGWGRCTGILTNQAMDCYDLATLSADGAALGAFAEGTTHFGSVRARHGAAAMSASNGITPWVGGASFVFVAGGIGDTQPSRSNEYAVVLTGGQLGAWNAAGSQFAQKRDGTQLQIANGFLYSFLGGPNGAYTSSVDLTNATTQTSATLTLGSWSNATASTPVGLGRMGVTLESAYFYVIGGTTNDLDAVGTVYQVIY